MHVYANFNTSIYIHLLLHNYVMFCDLKIAKVAKRSMGELTALPHTPLLNVWGSLGNPPSQILHTPLSGVGKVSSETMTSHHTHSGGHN